MIARLTVVDGTLTEYPLAEKVRGGWQNGVTFYPDEKVTRAVELRVIAVNRCVCTSAIAGISDGPNVDCPEHGTPYQCGFCGVACDESHICIAPAAPENRWTR